MSYDFQQLGTGSNKGGGVTDLFYFAPVSSFHPTGGIACPTPPFLTQVDEVVIASDHAFATVGDGFIKAYLAPNKNKMTASTSGDVGSLKFNQKAEVFLPGSYAELHAQIAGLLNEPVIGLMPDADCESGEVYQLGCDCSALYVETAEFTTGMIDGAEAKGYKITFRNYTQKVLMYRGNIALKTI